jgi:hypothetical protein
VGAGTVRVTASFEGLEDAATFEIVAAPPREPDAALLASIRNTIQMARDTVGASDFPAAFTLLDQMGTRIESLRAEFPDASSIGELHDLFMAEYQATWNACQEYLPVAESLGLPVPTCKRPPGGGG